jgi:phosphoribosylformimino-5-aminoimidazole carboxamide ribotide isomerase
MKFRPCIDLHNGVVKQIVGSTLSTSSLHHPTENFVSNLPPRDFAKRYKDDGLLGGHIIMLGPNCEKAVFEALMEFPFGFQVGGKN